MRKLLRRLSLSAFASLLLATLPVTFGVASAAIQQLCPTNTSNAGAPRADVSGAVSRTHFVVVTNSLLSAYRRDNCARIFTATLKGFFTSVGINGNDTFTEPRVIFDFYTQRFLVVVISHNAAHKNQSLYYAVSATPVGNDWHKERIRLNQAGCKVGTSEWFFPNLGVNDHRWFITANNFPETGSTTGSLLILDKLNTLIGFDPEFKCIRNLPQNLAPPIVRDGNDNAYFLSIGPDTGTTVQRLRVHTTGDVITDNVVATPNITVPFWQTIGPQFAEQINTCIVLVGDGRFEAASVQIGSFLWNVHTINDQVLQQSRWRLYKFPTLGTAPLLVHTPSFGALVHHNFNPSVAVGSVFPSRHAFVTYTRIIEPQEPGLPAGQRASMLIASGPNSSTNGWSFVRVAGSTFEPSCSLEDPFIQWSRSATQIDPTAHENFPEAWGFGQLQTGTSLPAWTTRATHVN